MVNDILKFIFSFTLLSVLVGCNTEVEFTPGAESSDGTISIVSPTISSVSPTFDQITGGTTITLTGTKFASGITATINGQTCTSPTLISDTSMTCVTPAHTHGTYDVKVLNSDGGAGTLSSSFTYFLPAPTLTSTAPTNGLEAGGATITLTGTNFASGITATINGFACTSPTFVSATSMTCVTPAIAGGLYDIIITNPDSQTATLSNGFTYTPSPSISTISPTSDIPAGGATITINGADFITGLTATINGQACTSPTFVSSTQMTCVAPAVAVGTYDIIVTNPDTQTGTKTNAFSYIASTAPTISSIAPAFDLPAGGKTITINGVNFAAGITATINGSACTTPTFVSSTKMTCVTPAIANGTYDVVVTNTDTKTGTATNGFTYSDTAFMSTWRTTGASESITIPLRSGLTYNYTIDWGDGTIQTGITSDANISHTYAVAGDYHVTITGTFPSIYFNNTGDKDKIIEVPSLGAVGWTTMYRAFKGCSNLTSLAGGDVSSVTTMYEMFRSATSVNPSISSWDVSNVTSMFAMFYGASTANPDVSNWDLTSLADISYMFRTATSANPVTTNWNTSSITDMEALFYGATAANPNVSNWDVSNVTNMQSLFRGATSAYPNVTNWNISAVKNLFASFEGISSNPDVSNWDTSAVTTMGKMFFNATTANPDISSWNTSLVTNMWQMFDGATAADPDMANLDLSSVTNFINILVSSNISITNFTNFLVRADASATATGQALGNIGDGTVKYTSAASAAYASLTGAKAWTINDGGLTGVAAPVLTSLSANSDVVAGGATITLTGTDFVSGAVISIGGTNCTSTTFNSATSLDCVVPAGTAGLQDIRVTNPDTQYADLTNGFTYTSDAFISKWKTTTSNESITIPQDSSLTYNFNVDWGDGNSETITTNTGFSHTYANAGTHTVTITGTFPAIYFNDTGDKDKIIEVPSLGATGWTSMYRAFRGCSNLTSLVGGDVSSVTRMNEMFRSATSVNPSISNWDVSNVTSMASMFQGASTANPDVSNWDTSSVTSMGAMFRYALVANPDTSGWNTSNVTSFKQMFADTSVANPDVSNWDVSNVGDFTSMFGSGANPDVSKWVLKSTGTVKMGAIFAGQTSNPDVSNWNTSNVTEISHMFKNNGQANPDMSGWDFTNITSFGTLLESSNISAVNYSKFLIALEATTPLTGVNLGSVPAKYLPSAVTARTNLVTNTWSFSDQGLNNDPAPTLTSLSANSDVVAGGATITLTGSDFVSGAVVSIGGTNCTSITFNSATSLDCVVPAGTAGLQDIRVTNPDTQYVDLANGFTYTSTAFISKWKTTSTNESITIPLLSGETYNYNIDWGDGTTQSGITADTDISHTYANAGTHTITITGTFPAIYINNSGDKDKIIEIPSLGSVGWTTFRNAFKGCSNLTTVSGGDTSNVTSFYYAFSYNTNLAHLGSSNWDTSSVVDMNAMFINSPLVNPDTSSWVTSSVTSRGLSNMFSGASSANPDVSTWDVSNVAEAASMFANATSATPDVSSWNTSSMTKIQYIFSGATLANPDVSSWSTSNLVLVQYAFNGASAADPDLSSWDMSNISNFEGAFNNSNISITNFTKFLIQADASATLTGETFGNVGNGTVQYTSAASAAHASLTGAKTWTMNDGGQTATASPVLTSLSANKDVAAGGATITLTGTDFVSGAVVSIGGTNCTTTTFTSSTSLDCVVPAGTIGVYNIRVTNPDSQYTESTNGFTYTSPAFISTWKTTAASESITIPLKAGETYNYNIDWGDGTTASGITSDADISHTYAVAGTYTVTITGTFPAIFFANAAASKDKIITIPSLGSTGWTTFSQAFSGCEALTSVIGGDTSSVTDMSSMFAESDLVQAYTATWDTSNVTNMSSMFTQVDGGSPDTSNWVTTNVTSMEGMFRYSTINPNTTNWDMSNVTSIKQMFNSNDTANPDVSNWNVSNIIDFTTAFGKGGKPDVSNWSLKTSGSIHMSGLFKELTHNPDVSSWNTVAVTNMDSLFAKNSLANPDTSSWNMAAVTEFKNFFQNSNSLTATNYSKFLIQAAATATVNNEDLANLPGGITYLPSASAARAYLVGTRNWTITGDTLDSTSFVSTWRTTTASETVTIPLKTGETYNYNIDWGDGTTASGITSDADISHTYATAGDYEITITGTFPAIYFNNSGDKDKIIEIGNLGSVGWTTFENAFYGCSNLTNVSGGVTTSVTNMNSMFRDASKAVVDVSTWDVSSVTNMDYMFSGATLANPDTTNWTLTALTSAINMFTNSALTYDNFDTFLARAAATNTNAVNLGTVPVSNSVSSAGSRTTLEGTHSWTINTTCPAGYAFVPNGGLAGADFCVMRYEAKDVGSSPTSQTALDPWVSISQTAAWNACDGLNSEGSRGDIDADTGGDGTYAMISNPEWMTIARNAEAVGSNWTGGATSTGIMAKGHTDSSNTAVATSTGSSCLYNTAADTCASTGTIDQRRTLTLSNGEEIWDMSGNVWEWVDWNMTSTLTTVTPAEKAYNSGDTQPISSGVEFPNLDSKIGGGDEMFPDSWQPTDTSLQSSDGVGRYFAGDNTSGGAARRGARWNSTTSAGVYTLILTVDSTSTSTYTGFRCVFRP